MTHSRINTFSEPPVFITLLVSPPLICVESVRFDVVATEIFRISSVTVDGKNGLRAKSILIKHESCLCVCLSVHVFSQPPKVPAS